MCLTSKQHSFRILWNLLDIVGTFEDLLHCAHVTKWPKADNDRRTVFLDRIGGKEEGL